MTSHSDRISLLDIAHDRQKADELTGRQISVQRLVQQNEGCTFTELLELCGQLAPRDLLRDLQILERHHTIVRRTRLRDGRDIWVTGVEIITNPALNG
jgi:hypothetical protein